MNGKGQFAVVLTVGAAAFSGGVALGHFLAQKRVQREIDDKLNEIWHEEQRKKSLETEAVRAMTAYSESGPKLPMETFDFVKPPKVEDFVSVIPPEDPRETPARVITTGRLDSISVVADENAPGYIVSVTPVLDKVGSDIPVEPESTNIFDDSIPGWNYPEELNAREGQDIYTITVSEFFANEADFKQSQLTYYKGDDMLCDSLDVPIHRYQQLVGNKLNFGHGSKDPNVVFIRNEKERMEWEICLDVGRYEEEVLGLTVEDDYEAKDLKHSVPRFYRE
jgi:hypothetical protein